MKLAFNLVDWQASAPGLFNAAQWLAWGKKPPVIDATAEIARSTHLPMMTARRLASGSRLAVDSALAMLERQQVDALVFASRHGELERNFKILRALAYQQAVSPTDFAMSVHNSAVGNATIAAKTPLVSSSVSAGLDTFGQALVEVAAFHYAGYKRVLMVDFDGAIPEFYQPWLAREQITFPFAVALLLEAGSQLQAESVPAAHNAATALPQSLSFLHALLSEAPTFAIGGERLLWQWSRK
ncbi:beta-ketoacyl synthase chain length factor [Enterobacteriaceae bacterium H20N1]|uniref:Beta-ketoacyl synthase chain length factor n=1 Tax=Dryocola boscaweniae TaxID=2925397 RepID=A0A9X3AEJ8_9ENTR|nr:beta-ketoacyl synthase chain length factor [Dryocola boscaweniae]MCT4704283.1 beta-ketoacyl synthase chain length factor [Dryocola boscaweniae]MCT4717470.1 beta-ketoacyl synthase chain length factor [Dryocola boscaweniae]MCT4721451.1 beta-ketoacyl synthase chain length factor [Dryocola boscaweniae]